MSEFSRFRLLAAAVGAAAVVATAASMAVAGPAVNASPAAVPPYFVQVAYNGNQNAVPTAPSYAEVRATATGAILGRVPAAKPGDTVLAVTAAADDRTFVLDEEKWISDSDRSQNSAWQTRSFYRLRLGADGRVASVTRLPMTASRLVTGVALSPDGTKLAIAVQPQTSADPNLTDLRVYTLATGSLRTWSGDGTIGGGPDDAASISWTTDGRLLFDWLGTGGPAKGPVTDGTRLLNPAEPGTSLLAGSRWVTSTTFRPSGPVDLSQPTCQGDTVITPDGSRVLCVAIGTSNQSISHGHLRRDATAEILEYSTATGKLAAVLGRWTIKNAGALTANVLWTSPSGRTLIAAIPNTGNGRIGVVTGGTFTQLALPGTFSSVW